MRRLACTAVTALVLATSGCGSGAVTRGELQRAVGTAYQRLYVLQQHQLGHPSPAPDRSAACTRSGSTARSGPGSWVCTVHFPYPDGHQVALTLDVEVQPIGCYTASAPPTIVGQQSLQSPTGASFINPLFAFDGCFRTA